MKRTERNIEDILERSLPSLSEEQLESARERIFNHVRAKAAADGEDSARRAHLDACRLEFDAARGAVLSDNRRDRGLRIVAARIGVDAELLQGVKVRAPLGNLI